MGSETTNSIDDWDYTLTDEDLRAIDAACAVYSDPAPPRKRRLPEYTDDSNSNYSPSSARRRLPDSVFSFTHCSRNRFRTSPCRSQFQDIKFGGHVLYSRTFEEVDRAAEELLNIVEAKKVMDGQCILGLDIEWKPTFRKGVPPGKAAVMQICEDMNRCHVLHIIHSRIPKNLQRLLEDPSYLKVGVCIANDASKVLVDHNVSINGLHDLSDLANHKLGGYKKWSLSSLTETLICKQLPKPNNIRLGNWEVKVLSKDQLNYAATDAYVSWYLYQVLQSLPDPTDTNPNSAETIVPTK